ncbi:MAG: hypothetical protein ACYSWW_01925 [Planctomycetota bacterium]|jgi:hypothetical protein
MRPRSHLMGALLFVLVLTVVAEDARAMPAFARKYRTSCATCHEAYPRLNGVGEAFRLNGYKFADDEMYIKDEPVEMGDEAYKRLWPSAIWPADIPGLPPISVTLDNDATYDIGGTESARTEFNFPQRAKVLGAGAVGETISAFLELGFTRQGAGGAGHHGGTATEEGTETDVEGWIQFEDLFGNQNSYNLRLGTIGMQEMGLFTARSHNSFSISNYLYSAWSMPSPSDHNIEDIIAGITDHDDIDFDGNPFTVHAQPGAELNGFGRSWRYALGIVNGNGDNFNDNNTEKDVYLQVAHKIGGIGFDGSGMEEGDDLSAASDPWRDDSVTVSVFGYWGTSPVDIERAADGFESVESDRYWRVGPGLLWRTGDLQLGGGYIWGKNDNPFGALSNGAVDSKSWFAEVNYFAKPWLIPYARYETLELRLPTEVTSTDEATWANGADQERVVVGSKMLIRANVSLGLEGILYVKDDRETSNDDNSAFIASLRFAF